MNVTDRRFFESPCRFFWRGLPSPHVSYGIFLIWTCEINPTSLGSVPSGVSDEQCALNIITSVSVMNTKLLLYWTIILLIMDNYYYYYQPNYSHYSCFCSLTMSACFSVCASVCWWRHPGVPAAAGGHPARRRPRRTGGGPDAERPPPPGVSVLPEHVRHSPGSYQLLHAARLHDQSTDIPAEQGEAGFPLSVSSVCSSVESQSCWYCDKKCFIFSLR